MRNLAKELRDILNSIPKGYVMTYGEVAEKMGINPRHVGYLLSKNDSSKAPCYKVVKSDGSLGGYSAPGGLKKKIELLKNDGIVIKNDKINRI